MLGVLIRGLRMEHGSEVLALFYGASLCDPPDFWVGTSDKLRQTYIRITVQLSFHPWLHLMSVGGVESRHDKIHLGGRN